MKQAFSLFTILFYFIVFTTGFSGSAQDTQPYQMLSMKGHIVKSSSNGKSYQLYVSLPAGYTQNESTRYPVLYLLDANYSFPIASSVHKLLDAAGDIDKVIIVAIGDEDQSDKQWTISRTLDYTPTSDSFANTDIARGSNIDIFAVKSGGAKAFLATIRTDIIPFIDKHYKTTNEHGIAGHSLGGLFAGYCFLNEPDLFSKYGMSSPSFLWDNSEILTTQKFHATTPANRNTKVFVSIGSLEPKVMFPPIDAFVKSLKEKNYIGLQLTYETFQGETHGSVMAASISRMLKVLYPGN